MANFGIVMIKPSPFLAAPGERYLDFVVTKVKPIDELQCVLKELTHLPSGASIMHIDNDDPENLFCLSLRTLPQNSNGVAHILEHTVLCGSEHFPVKDPFFSMQRRSLNTFMNALTGADFTCYPAASQVEKDFYNLLDVYLDAVFHPQIKRLSFLQEGHRLEFAISDDPKTPLEYKGIVFNEMKGSLASSDARLWHAMMACLVPDLTYAFNSGGDPKEIPQLTYEELVSFHDTYYHPSRCLFFFYGNLPLKKHLDFIANKVLNTTSKRSPIPSIPRQTRFTAPKQHEMHYPVNETDELSSRSIVAFGWLTCPLIEQEEVLALTLLDSILMENDASLLKSKLLQTKLCVHADAYMDTEMSEVPYLIAFKGCASDSGQAIEETLFKALREVVKEGIPASYIDAALHQLELSRLEITGDHSPFGLTLFMRSALAKQHGCEPENSLMIHSLFEKLLAKTKNPSYLTGLIQKYFIDNPHRIQLIMHPDPQLSAQENAEEKRQLKEIQQKLTREESLKIVQQAQELKAFQKKTEEQSIDCLPKVTLKDVPPLVRDFPLEIKQVGPLKVFHHDCFTNHLLYADLEFNLPPISDEDLPYVHLLTTLLSELGSGTRKYTENLDYIQAHTGGISASCSLHLQVADPKYTKPAISLRGKSLYRKADKLCSLMRDTLTSPRFDEKTRIYDLIKQLREGQLQRLSRQAMRYAIQLSLSGLSSAAHVNEAWYGLRYFKFIEELSKNLKANLPKIIEKLIALHHQLFTFNEPHLSLGCSTTMRDELEQHGFYGLNQLPQSPSPFWDVRFPTTTVISQGRVMASQVAFTVEAFPTITYIHPHAPGLLLATNLFENKILHKKIREQGGAYGCGATFNPGAGFFYFHAFRDPHIASSLSAFQLAIEEIAAEKFTTQDLEEAKLGVIQHLDVPISPGSRASSAYAWYRMGKTKEMRQQFRDRLLAATPKEIAHIVTTELLPKKHRGVIVSCAGQEQLHSENLILTQSGRPLHIAPL